MSKEESNKTRYCVQWNAHERYMCTVLCSLMEHQSLVDLAMCCGNNTIHVHKCILAANSAYFREQLEKNTSAEQVIINGLDFVIIKSIIEFIYCGETVVPDENMKYVIAAAKVFQIRGLQALASEVGEFSGGVNGDQVYIPPPIFISKKPKYPTAFRPFNTLSIQQANINKGFSPAYEQLLQKKIKRKYLKSEAEKACAKEAAASRQALEALQKELSIQPQVNSFVIEDSCTETTVENFIPHHADGRFVENVRDFQGLPVVNYYSVNGTGYANRGQAEKSLTANPLLQFNIRNDGNTHTDIAAPADKVKGVLDGDITHNVEIMFKTSEGDFVSVTDELLQNISKSALQYQVIDENGFAGEMQELRVLNKVLLDPEEMSHKFIYEQEELHPSVIEIPKVVDQNTSAEAENRDKEKTPEDETPSEPSDALMKDLPIEGNKSVDDPCLDMLIPAHPDDGEKGALAATTESFITGFALSEDNTNILDYHTVLEGVGGDLEGCSAVKKRKLMDDPDETPVLHLEELNQIEENIPVVMQFSPRRTRSTIKCRNRASEGENDVESIKQDMIKTRKSK